MFEDSTRLKLFGIGAGSLFLLFLAFSSAFTVGQNEETVATQYGKLQYVADPGLHFKAPLITSAQAFPTDIQELHPSKGVNTYTVDNQEVDVVFTVFYRLPADKVGFVFTNNRDYAARLYALTIDRLKAAMGQVNVQSVAEKRGELRDTIKATLAKDAAGLGIEVTDFQLTDMQYTDAFRGAVNNAAVQKANIEAVEYQRQQAQKQAEIDKTKAAGEANAQREQAAGAADARLLQAQAEAKAIQLQGEAQAAAIKAQSEALASNQKLVDYKKAERWDGKLPTTMLSNVMPFMNTDAAIAGSK